MQKSVEMLKRYSNRDEMLRLFETICETTVDPNSDSHKSFFIARLKEVNQSNGERSDAVKVGLLSVICKFRAVDEEIEYILEHFFNELCSFERGQRFVEKQSSAEAFAAIVLEKAQLGNCSALDVHLSLIANAHDNLLPQVINCVCDYIVLDGRSNSFDKYATLQRASELLTQKLGKLLSEDGDPEMEIFERAVDEATTSNLSRVKKKLECEEE